VLDDPSFRTAAAGLGEQLRAEADSDAALAELEPLACSSNPIGDRLADSRLVSEPLGVDEIAQRTVRGLQGNADLRCNDRPRQDKPSRDQLQRPPLAPQPLDRCVERLRSLDR
jgi:hypothetical protein